MQRRSAKKSRFGCKECKRRHVKCDEAKPVCSDCRIRNLHCSYISTSTLTLSSQSISNDYGDDNDNDNDNTPGLSPHSRFEYTSNNQTFKLHDLELFHNFKANVWSVLSPDEFPVAQRFTEVIIQHSFSRPYLMDQLLALSAAHMSTQRPHQSSFYRQEATRRQTQALTLFNTSPTAKDTDECLPAFFFSILLSYQVLFDALASRDDFSAFLDKLTKGFRLCGGVRAMAGHSLDSLVMQYRQEVGSELLEMERVWKSPDTGFGAVTRVLRWVVTVRPEFVELIEQRRPEALIIIAHFGVLLHDARDCWIFGDAGAYIIRSITGFLGSYWAEWLAWPNEMLDEAHYIV
ncbi:hypothetical protein F5Y03DRAFT_388680 [Xylaria venustula]|nr:hypothetical protein F5Y03DRAFT_388680 [Xylaria venustula]